MYASVAIRVCVYVICIIFIRDTQLYHTKHILYKFMFNCVLLFTYYLRKQYTKMFITLLFLISIIM